MENQEIRYALEITGVKYWQLAEALNISQNTLTRRLRTKLDKEVQKMYLSEICKIAKKRILEIEKLIERGI